MELLVRKIPSRAKAQLYVFGCGAPEGAPFQNFSYCATPPDSVLGSDSVSRLVAPRPLGFALALDGCKSSRVGGSS
jgi:hypothetical protein